MYFRRRKKEGLIFYRGNEHRISRAYFTTSVCVDDSKGPLGGAGGEIVGAIADGEVPMDGEGATPPRVKEKDGVEVERVVAACEGVDFGKEADDELVSKEASATPRA